MNIIGTNTSGLTTSIWGTSVRAITSLGTALAPSGVQDGTIAASTTVTITQAANTAGLISFGSRAGAAGAVNYNLNDGTNDYSLGVAVAGGNSTVPAVFLVNGFSIKLSNVDAANAAKYAYTIIQLS